MKKILLLITPLIACALITSCSRSSSEVWDDSYTAGRYWGKGFQSLGGKNGDCRQKRSRGEFECDNDCFDDSCYETYGFVPLQDESGNELIAMTSVEQSQFAPGEPDSHIPGIESFSDPVENPSIAFVFEHVHFPYNSDLIQGEKNLQTIHNIADHLKNNPNTYVFVEGHCDERGAEAYNLALGTRRANTVRNILVQEGVSADQLFTISYGKEHPIAFGGNETAWALNRRSQFKTWTRR